MSSPPLQLSNDKDDYSISLKPYKDEKTHLEIITNLIQDELSEPYIIYTYRYFLNQWPNLTFLAYAHRNTPGREGASMVQESGSRVNQSTSESTHEGSEGQEQEKKVGREDQLEGKASAIPIGVIVSKLDRHLKGQRRMRGYIAMLSVDPKWRRKGVASLLVRHTLGTMIEDGAQEVVLETEVDNSSSLSLYQSLGFIKEKRLYRFYLNGKDSFRLILPVPTDNEDEESEDEEGRNNQSGLSPIVNSSMIL